jgi:endonuclease-8
MPPVESACRLRWIPRMEGPSLAILKAELAPFLGRPVLRVGGNSSLLTLHFKKRIRQTGLSDVKTWGKHLLLGFGDLWFRIHFLMYGSYRVRERRPGKKERIRFVFPGGEFNLYSCSVKILDRPPERIYDWRTDLMSSALE